MGAYDTIQEAKRLKEWIIAQGEDDPELIKDMIEGETSLEGLRDWAIQKFLDEKAFGEAIKNRVVDIQTRGKASEKRMENMKLMLTDIMNVTGETSIKTPEATLSMRTPKAKLTITDEAKIPDRFFKTEKKLIKTDLNKAYEAGEQIEGVALSNNAPSLTIRSK